MPFKNRLRNYSGHVVDIEASGISPDSYPIEVGVVMQDGRRYSSLIKPMRHWQHWCPDAEAIHGISREQLMDEGVDPEIVCQQINDLCSAQVLYSDCWIHDEQWIKRLFYDAASRPRFQCRSIEHLLTETQLEQWVQRKQAMASVLALAPHRALNDARIIQAVLDQAAKALGRYERQHPANLWAQTAPADWHINSSTTIATTVR